MIYIFGAKIQDNTLVVQGISKIFGIGSETSKKICKEFGFLNKLKIFNLSRGD
jgi:ribosomal protein S13